jgi:hypothetical protein
MRDDPVKQGEILRRSGEYSYRHLESRGRAAVVFRARSSKNYQTPFRAI